MAESPVFERICDELEARSALGRLGARGTVRIALKAAGLEARSVRPDQMAVVLERVLPGELAARGVDDAAGICGALVDGLVASDFRAPTDDSPEDVFRRLGEN